jgi:hypothetical protein
MYFFAILIFAQVELYIDRTHQSVYRACYGNDITSYCIQYISTLHMVLDVSTIYSMIDVHFHFCRAYHEKISFSCSAKKIDRIFLNACTSSDLVTF